MPVIVPDPSRAPAGAQDYHQHVRATAAVTLGAADSVAGKPFTELAETARDVAELSSMLQRERASVRGCDRQAGPAVIEREEDGRRHFLALPDVAALFAARDVTAVGFFGQARASRDSAVLFALEREVVESFPLYATRGLLSYYDVELDDSRFGNLILFATPDVPAEWYENAAHERAVEISPQHYHSVRLHKGSIPGPLLGEGGLTLERTKYFDFDTDPPWRAIRVLSPA
jgi:hypothetical protein